MERCKSEKYWELVMIGWLRIRQAAEYCGVCERTVRLWISEEGLPISKVRGTVLVSRTDLDSFLKSFSVSDNQKNKIDKIVDEVISEL